MKTRLYAPYGFYIGEWRAVLEHHGNACVACGVVGVELVPDHIQPLSRGGLDDISNIQPLCRTCNTRKGAQTIDYRRSIPNIQPTPYKPRGGCPQRLNRILLEVPDVLRARLDAYRTACGMSMSGLLRQAAIEYLEQHVPSAPATAGDESSE